MQPNRLARLAIPLFTLILSTALLAAPPRISIAEVKQSSDGSEVGCELARVTAVFGDVIYIQQQDRAAGIRVEGVAKPYSLGQPVYIAGILRTSDEGERFLECMDDSGLAGLEPIRPLFLPNKALGGTNWFFDPETGAGQLGVTEGSGLNSIGLLVRTGGSVTLMDSAVPPKWLYLDDGSGAPVKVALPAGVAVDSGLQAAVVTGICARESFGRVSHPVILVRRPSDIATNDARLTAYFTATPTPAQPHQAVTFDGTLSKSGLPSRSIASYEWDFDCPDGNFAPVATGAVVTHAYPAAGTYTVCLRVTDSGNAARTATYDSQVSVVQSNRPPTADPGGPYAIEQGFGLLLDGSGSSDPDAAFGDAIAAWEWDLNGDSAFDVSGESPSLSWAQLQALGVGVGQRTIALRVTDFHGEQHTVSTTLNVYINAPVAVATADKTVVGAATEITFSGSQSCHGSPNRRIVSYEWDFDYNPGMGFAADATGATVKHTYFTNGSHVTALRVADDNVPVKTAIATVMIQVQFQNIAPVARPGGPYTIGAGSDLQLDGASSYDPNWPGDTIISFDWDLNLDGIYDAGGWTPLLPWEYLQSLGIGPGSRTIRLRVTDSYGTSSTATTTLTVQ